MEENNNKKVILTIIILILVVGGFIYYAKNPTVNEQPIKDIIAEKVTSESKVMIVEAGANFTISLEASPNKGTEGYWTPVFDEGSLEIVKEETKTGLLIFELKALKEGVAEITFNYVKSEEDIAPTNIKIFKIFVGTID